MEIIKHDELFFCGFLVKPSGGNSWEKYEKTTEIYEPPELIDWTGYEVWFFPTEGEQVFTACRQKEKIVSSHYELLCIPAMEWVVFDIDHKIDQNPQYADIDKWFAENKNVYKRFLWDANGRVGISEFVICRFDHDGKFGKEQIMEYWIPIVRIAE
ncbi:MAG: hypothetical protein FWE90_02685 [Defluviitaleaceae bacterium]|nr:hypothetical protein [Defluviitaleaceae bacterium]